MNLGQYKQNSKSTEDFSVVECSRNLTQNLPLIHYSDQTITIVYPKWNWGILRLGIHIHSFAGCEIYTSHSNFKNQMSCAHQISLCGVLSWYFCFCISVLSWPYFSRAWWKTLTYQILHESVHGGLRYGSMNSLLAPLKAVYIDLVHNCLEPGQFTLNSMALIRYSCGHILGPHKPIPTKFGLWRF